jgi:hypothetical protein
VPISFAAAPRTRRLVGALSIVTVVGGFAWYQSLPHVPDGQPPLVTLDANALAALRNDFNQKADRVRLIVLLAPT